MDESQVYGTDTQRLSGFFADKEEELRNPDNYHDIQMIHVTEIIAVKYEQKKEWRNAIRWYKKNLHHVLNVKKEDTAQILGGSLNNLGLAQKRAGLFQEALQNYTRAKELGNDGPKHNIRVLKDEIDEWIGTSGHVTPRLDE
jgi:tetratricopeptide (TPR) repeat protein